MTVITAELYKEGILFRKILGMILSILKYMCTYNIISYPIVVPKTNVISV